MGNFPLDGMGRDSTHLYFPWDMEIEWECQNVTELSYLDYTSEFEANTFCRVACLFVHVVLFSRY